jgi:tetratricopeptide (TPR) repeat protein
LLAVCLFSLAAFSQTLDNRELNKMYDEDQGARSVPNINWAELSKQDRAREARVYELIKSGQVTTAKDYFHSAMIFQHGADSVAYGMAVKQMRKAIDLDTSIDRWLLAAAIDRDLMSRGKPQIYGTQFRKMGQDAKWDRYRIDSTQVSDEERKYYHVETLSQQLVKEKNMNLLSVADFYAKSGSIEETVKLIQSENKKQDDAAYNTSEAGINEFGYGLLAEKKQQEALIIFTLNTTLYPNAYNAFDSLGECLFLMNKKEDGIKAYQRSLELNPKNDNAKKMISEIK